MRCIHGGTAKPWPAPSAAAGTAAATKATRATSRHRLGISADRIGLAIGRGLVCLRLRLSPIERLDLLGQPRLLRLHLRKRAGARFTLTAVLLLHAAPHPAAHEDHHQAHPDRAGQQCQEEQRTRGSNQHSLSPIPKVTSYRTVV